MLQSKDDEASLHDITNFAFAKEVLSSHPRIIAIYSKLLPVLYQFAIYQAVWPVIELVEQSKELAEIQLTYYRKIYNTKGLVDAEKIKK